MHTISCVAQCCTFNCLGTPHPTCHAASAWGHHQGAIISHRRANMASFIARCQASSNTSRLFPFLFSSAPAASLQHALSVTGDAACTSQHWPSGGNSSSAAGPSTSSGLPSSSPVAHAAQAQLLPGPSQSAGPAGLCVWNGVLYPHSRPPLLQQLLELQQPVQRPEQALASTAQLWHPVLEPPVPGPTTSITGS